MTRFIPAVACIATVIVNSLAASCNSSSPAASTGPVRVFTMVVRGSVLTSAGQAVGGAVVTITPLDLIGVVRDRIGSCGGVKDLPPRVTVTGVDGSYSVTLGAAGPPHSVCIAVQVAPPPGSGLSPGFGVIDSTTIGPRGYGVDTVRLAVRLSP